MPVTDSTTLRDRAAKQAVTDSNGAEATADQIQDPWFRAQALAWVTRYGPEGQLERLGGKALDAAASATDPYEQAGAAAWVVRALIERQRSDLALTMLEMAMQAVPRIEADASRSQALFLLYQASFEAADVRRSILFALAELQDRSPHWRVARNFRDALLMAKATDAELVAKLAVGGNDKQTAKLQKALQSETLEPRVFFW